MRAVPSNSRANACQSLHATRKTRLAETPSCVARKRGELKYLLLTESQLDGGMMLRFVLRSGDDAPRPARSDPPLARL